MSVLIVKASPIEKKYKTIAADPPWAEHGGGKVQRGADRHYDLMKTAEIAAFGMRVQLIADKDAHLYLWATNNHLEDALSILPAWGFKFVTMITWVKEGKPGLGQYFRGLTEHCIFAKRGQPTYRVGINGKRAQGLTALLDEGRGLWFKAKRGKHSEKPAQLYTWARSVSHGPYLEMFARVARPGWDSWGIEAPTSTKVNL
jgi:N6-adenosine-specific RNA methylase IME4